MAVVAWGAAIVGGLFAIARYELTPGGGERPPTGWPAASGLVRAMDRPTVVLAAHPRCPCTLATLEMLGTVLDRADRPARVIVLMFAPAEPDGAWMGTAQWRMAAALRGAGVVIDRGGVEAARFGACTSGHVLVYGVDGGLLFSGGVTGGRGHVGENAGAEAVAGVLGGHWGSTGMVCTPVFGCSIVGAGVECIATCGDGDGGRDP